MIQNKKINMQSGAAMLVAVIFFMVAALSIVVELVSPSVREYKIARDVFQSRQSFFLSESGVEDAFYRLKTGKALGSSTLINLNGNTATTSITSGLGVTTISSVGDVNLRQRINSMAVSSGLGVSFNYGVQTGEGGINLGNNSSVEGSVYANGPITGSGSITGSATSANSPALASDQANGSGTPAYDVNFGNTTATQDFAQSFTVSATGAGNKVQFYLKKVGSPANLTIRLTANSSGSPATTSIATGTLSASLVSTSYGWIDVPFSTNPELAVNTTYWIVVDSAVSATNYYTIGANSNGYANGAGKIGTYGGTWNATTPAGLDYFFNLFMGGLTGSITSTVVGTGTVGNAYAHTVNSATIRGTNYCQTGSGNNKVCNTSLTDPTSIAMPISDANIADWKTAAAAGGIYTGNFTLDGSSATYGTRKIVGNLTVQNNSTLTFTGVIWITGNLDINNNGIVKVPTTFGNNSGVIITDGTITVSNNGSFTGSGNASSFVMALSTSNSTSAITVNNNAGTVILYAANGTINLNSTAEAKEVNGYRIVLGNNAHIRYTSGLVNQNFVSGPSGGWSISNWGEI